MIRYLASRASLLALPDGPVTGLDLSSGELVGLSFGPGMSDPAELASRIDTWNRLALPGCPAGGGIRSQRCDRDCDRHGGLLHCPLAARIADRRRRRLGRRNLQHG